LDEILIERLLEQRDVYLNTLKQIDFQMVTEPTENELNDIKEFQNKIIGELKKLEQELAYQISK